MLIVLATLSAQALPAAASGKGKAEDPSVEPATIEFWNRPIAVLRSSLAGADPQDRAERAMQRLEELPPATRASDVEVHPIKVEDEDGVGFTCNGNVLFFLGTKDLDEERGETLASASNAALQALGEALQARASEREWPVIRRGVLFTLLGIALLIAFLWLVWRAYHAAFDYLRSKEHSFPIKLRLFGVDLLPHIAGLIYTLLRVAAWLLPSAQSIPG